MSKGWRWQRGMLTMSGLRVFDVSPDGTMLDLVDTDTGDLAYEPADQHQPNFDDAATLGCLLVAALVAALTRYVADRGGGDRGGVSSDRGRRPQ